MSPEFTISFTRPDNITVSFVHPLPSFERSALASVIIQAIHEFYEMNPPKETL
jgi:hypothetical protein